MVASSLLMLTGCSAEKSPVQVLDETLQYWKNKDEKSFKKSFKNKKVAMYSLIETSADDNKDLIEISKKLEEKIYSGLKYKIYPTVKMMQAMRLSMYKFLQLILIAS